MYIYIYICMYIYTLSLDNTTFLVTNIIYRIASIRFLAESAFDLLGYCSWDILFFRKTVRFLLFLAKPYYQKVQIDPDVFLGFRWERVFAFQMISQVLVVRGVSYSYFPYNFIVLPGLSADGPRPHGSGSGPLRFRRPCPAPEIWVKEQAHKKA